MIFRIANLSAEFQWFVDRSDSSRADRLNQGQCDIDVTSHNRSRFQRPLQITSNVLT